MQLYDRAACERRKELDVGTTRHFQIQENTTIPRRLAVRLERFAYPLKGQHYQLFKLRERCVNEKQQERKFL